jgi:hypothetical protein
MGHPFALAARFAGSAFSGAGELVPGEVNRSARRASPSTSVQLPVLVLNDVAERIGCELGQCGVAENVRAIASPS